MGVSVLKQRRLWAAGLALAVTVSTQGVARAERIEGEILLPVGTASNIPRMLYHAGMDGITGDVVRFKHVIRQGSDYRLTRTDGSASTDLDLWLYEDINDANSICRLPRSEPDGEGGETGEFTCDTRWAVVVLFTGVDAEFELDA
jgi:hypothetical protein